MANSDNSSPPPVDPVDQLAELRRKRGAKPGRALAPRSGRQPTRRSDRNRSAGADALNGAGPLGAGLGPSLDLDDVDEALDAITAELEPTTTRTSAPKPPEPPAETDVDTQLDAAVAHTRGCRTNQRPLDLLTTARETDVVYGRLSGSEHLVELI
jgi:hypothetical protein